MKINTQQLFEQLQHLVMKKGNTKKKKKKKIKETAKPLTLSAGLCFRYPSLLATPYGFFIIIILIKQGTPEGLLILPFYPKYADEKADSVV